MASIDYFRGNGSYAPPTATFDITSIVAERIGAFVYYFSFDTDGTMFILHTSGGRILGWDHFSGATLLQSGSTDLALQPFLDIMGSRNPSSTKAMAYVYGTNDLLTGSRFKDEMVAGGGADTLNGGAGDDRLNGGTGQDVLNGGAGADRLVGGADADSFVFASPGDGGDKISDFVAGQDHVDLVAYGFGLTGPLVGGVNFSAAGAAVSAQASMTYDAATGILAYDADGTGTGAAVTLATLTNHATLGLGDIWLV